MLRPYLKIWEWEWIFGHAVKAISSPGVRSVFSDGFFFQRNNLLDFETKSVNKFQNGSQRYTYRVLQTIQMNLMLLWVWAEWAELKLL